MFEVLNHHLSSIEASDVLSRLGLVEGRFVLVSCHREENVDSDRQITRLVQTLDAVAARYDEPIVVSTHPRTRKRIDALGLTFDPRVQLLKPFGFLDFNALQLRARAVLSDSGTISEESAILNFPALNLRDAHERPEAMEEAAVMMTGLDPDRVLQGLEILESERQLKRARGETRMVRLPADYSAPDVSDKVVRIILSYTDYVRRTVWREA